MHRANVFLLLGLSVCSLQTVSAQTAAPVTPAPSSTSAPGTASSPAPGADTAPAVMEPTPTPQTVDQIQARPAYAPDPIDTPSRPTPTPAPPPAVAPAQGNPYSAWPPYRTSAYQNYLPTEDKQKKSHDSSAYIPVDSWVYPEILRLYSMGYVDTMFLALRPYTRLSLLHMLDQSQDDIIGGENEEAKEILAKLLTYLSTERTTPNDRGLVYGADAVYGRVMGIGGTTLRDSWHLGQSIINDYGRTYEPGFNSILGFSTLTERGRFSLNVRGEYEHSPSAAGYSQALSSQLSFIDAIPFVGPSTHQATIPTGPIAAANPFRLVEATLSFHFLGHEISGGKSDAWQGPGLGGAFAWSNNAENIYSFRINRVEPLHIPYLSALLGPVRYDFFYGSLKGHTEPNHPYAHSEMISFHPSTNFEFSFQRTIIFGGAGHEPVNLHTFLKGFFDVSDTTDAEKHSRDDPGARFSSFSFSYRLPFVRNHLTLYSDSETHDDIFPVSAPRRAGWLSGLYLSSIPHLPKLDLRAEAVYTDYPTLRSTFGNANYFETVQRQGYTNQGFVMGHWIGREAKGGQFFATYHLSGNESVQLEYLNKKTAKDFIPGGTTQNSFKVSVIKRLGQDLELNAWYQYERWKAPIYLTGQQNDSVGAFQVTYYPKIHVLPGR